MIPVIVVYLNGVPVRRVSATPVPPNPGSQMAIRVWGDEVLTALGRAFTRSDDLVVELRWETGGDAS